MHDGIVGITHRQKTNQETTHWDGRCEEKEKNKEARGKKMETGT